jgi:hypothetical protein
MWVLMTYTTAHVMEKRGSMEKSLNSDKFESDDSDRFKSDDEFEDGEEGSVITSIICSTIPMWLEREKRKREEFEKGEE